MKMCVRLTVTVGAMAALFTIQGAITANVVAGLILMAPALVLTPLLWQPLTQPAAPAEV